MIFTLIAIMRHNILTRKANADDVITNTIIIKIMKRLIRLVKMVLSIITTIITRVIK